MSHSYRAGGGGSSGPQLCENCHKRPKFGTFDYCGRTCADEAKRLGKGSSGGGSLWGLINPFGDRGGEEEDAYGRNSTQYPNRSSAGSSYGAPMQGRPGTDNNLCENCHARPKFTEQDTKTGNIIIYPFCGRNCRNVNAQANVQRCQLRECGKTCQGLYCSPKHAKKAVQKGEAIPCAYCQELPATQGYEYCSKDCGMKDAREKERNQPLTYIPPDQNQAISIAKRFRDRWDDPRLATPEIVAIYQINVAKKYENRFKDAVNAAEALGGSTTKSAFYGGQCICDLGVQQFGGNQLCSWGSCSICIVIRKCFDILEFKNPHHVGDLGKGIYASLNPANANRFTVRKSNHPIRAIILCSVIHLDDFVQGDKKKYSAFIETETNRVFCANKDVILPRQLILYKDPDPRSILL